MVFAASVPSSPACPWTTTVEPGLRSESVPCWVTPTVVESDVDTLTSLPCAVFTYTVVPSTWSTVPVVPRPPAPRQPPCPAAPGVLLLSLLPGRFCADGVLLPIAAPALAPPPFAFACSTCPAGRGCPG